MKFHWHNYQYPWENIWEYVANLEVAKNNETTIYVILSISNHTLLV